MTILLVCTASVVVVLAGLVMVLVFRVLKLGRRVHQLSVRAAANSKCLQTLRQTKPSGLHRHGSSYGKRV